MGVMFHDALVGEGNIKVFFRRIAAEGVDPDTAWSLTSYAPRKLEFEGLVDFVVEEARRRSAAAKAPMRILFNPVIEQVAGGQSLSDQAVVELNRRLEIDSEFEGFVAPQELLVQLRPSEIRRLASALGQSDRPNSWEEPPVLRSYLEIRFIAARLGPMYTELRRLAPVIFGRFVDAVPYDFGAESLIFRARDVKSDTEVALKVAFADYSNPARIDVEAMQRRRERLIKEAELLQSGASLVLPRFVAVEIGENPYIPRGFPSRIRENETCLAMEFIEGTRVDIAVRRLRRDGSVSDVCDLALRFGVAQLDLQIGLRKTLGGGAAYTDIKPENAILQHGQIRIVDAGGIHITGRNNEQPRASALYLTPQDHAAWLKGTLVPNRGFVQRSVGRCMRMMVTNCAAKVGEELPPWEGWVPESVQSTIDALVSSEDGLDQRRVDLQAVAQSL